MNKTIIETYRTLPNMLDEDKYDDHRHVLKNTSNQISYELLLYLFTKIENEMNLSQCE